MTNRYYSIMRPIGIGTFPPGAHVTNIVNFHQRMYVPEIGREAWGYIEFSHTLSKQNQMNYELLPGGGMSMKQFRSSFTGVLTDKDIDRLAAFAVYGYKKAHGITKVSESERALARLELMNHLYSLVDDADVAENLIAFAEGAKIKADVYDLGERLIDLKESTMVE